MKSTFLSLSKNDLIRGAVIAGIIAGGNSLLQILDSYINTNAGHPLPTGHELLFSLKIAGGAALSYLFKNFITNSSDQLLKKEAK